MWGCNMSTGPCMRLACQCHMKVGSMCTLITLARFRFHHKHISSAAPWFIKVTVFVKVACALCLEACWCATILGHVCLGHGTCASSS